MITLLSAGHETVSDSITWAFFELMKDPEAYTRVQAEAGEVQATEPLAAASASPFITTVIQEALRLYPPGWGFLRTAIDDDTICGYRIPAGARVVVSPYLMQRDAQYWPEPDRFDPERFTAERSAGRHRFAWFPFSAGPRQCIGAGLAMLEAQLTIQKLSRAVRLELVPGQSIRPLPRVSLKPNGPVMVRARLEKRLEEHA
jgi:cytochrome P450